MADYTIDGNNLATLGFDVELVEGYETIPGRKGETYQSWEDSDSIEPFVDADDILLNEREITIKLYLRVTNTIDAQNKLKSLEDILYATGNRTLAMSFLTNTYICYCKEGMKVVRKTNLANELIGYFVTLKILELDPSI